MSTEAQPIIVRRLTELQDYAPIHQAMLEFTAKRTLDTPDEIWVLQHHPVFTQGQAGKAEHLLNPGQIPVVQSDRGGQITYHGPGQWILYFLLDLKRLKLGPRALVTWVEQGVIEALDRLGVAAYAKPDAPGVYIRAQSPMGEEERKIASLGLRIKQGKSFHGLALNVDMDLEPFQRINPCGYEGMTMTQLKDLLGGSISMQSAADVLLEALLDSMPYGERLEIGHSDLNQDNLTNDQA